METTIGSRFKSAWNAFFNRDPTNTYRDVGPSYSYRPDRPRMSRGNERSIVTSIINRLALDVAAIDIRHVKLDANGRYVEDVCSGLNECLTLEANIDQTSRAFKQDIVISMCDEGVVGIAPIDTDRDTEITNSYDIYSMRTAKITEWCPAHVKVEAYNDRTGTHGTLQFPKSDIASV